MEDLPPLLRAPCPTCRREFRASEVTTIDVHSSASSSGGVGSGLEVAARSLSAFLSCERVGGADVECGVRLEPQQGASAASITAPVAACSEISLPAGVFSTSHVNSGAAAALVEPLNDAQPPAAESSETEDHAPMRRVDVHGHPGRRGRPLGLPLADPTAAVAAPAASAADRLGGKLVALVRRLHALPPGERAVVATSWPALRPVIGAALRSQGVPTAVLDGSPSQLAAAVGEFIAPQSRMVSDPRNCLLRDCLVCS